MNELQKNDEINFTDFTNDKIDLIKKTVCKGASDEELKLFLHVCIRTGLDPFMRQIYSVPRGTQRTIQTSIDGLRLIAERTGRYAPGKEAIFNYDANGKLISATSFIKKMTADGTWHEVSATAIHDEYCPGNNSFWKKMPHVMISKCAEALALRKAFPAEMSNLYTKEEMDQASSTLETEVPAQDSRNIDEETNKFLSKFEEAEHEDIKKYIAAVSAHFKKSVLETLDLFQSDLEEFKKKFEIWRAKQKSKA